MNKRLIIYALVLLGIDAMGVASAGGGYSLRVKSLSCDGDVTGIAQRECPTGVGTCTVRCDLVNADVLFACANGGGQIGGGPPFGGTASFGSDTLVFADTPINGTGSEHVEITISDSKIIMALNPLCTQQNVNWGIATEEGFCMNDADNYLRPIMVVKDTIMEVTATDTQGDETVYESQCTLNPDYNNLPDETLLGIAPLCPEQFVDITAYNCSNNKSLNLR